MVASRIAYFINLQRLHNDGTIATWVTGLGEFLPNGRLFTLGTFSKMADWA
jgi:hypothetical protein